MQPSKPEALPKATGLATDSALPAGTPAAGIDLSAKLMSSQQVQWQAENREAIAAYNRHVEEQGVFSDGLDLLFSGI